jgi:beta-galactosidase
VECTRSDSPRNPHLRLVAALLALVAFPGAALAAFPAGFRWGTAISAFQTEMGADPAHEDAGSDWWVWVRDADNVSNGRVSGDLPENGPAFYDAYRRQLRHDARRGLRSNAIRLSIDWSRIFPTSTAGVDATGGITLAVLQQLDALADQAEVAHYRKVLRAVPRRMTRFVTANHFTLPLWIHDPIAARDAFTGADPNGPPPSGFGPAGWLDPATVREFEKYCAYLAWKFGDLVDVWAPVNEPLVIAVNGYINIPHAFGGNFPPAAFSFTAVVQVVLNLIEAERVAYDAIHTWDTTDADRDGVAATVGLVHNMIAFHPQNPASPLDVQGAEHADYLFNRVYLNATIDGDVDANLNGTIDPGEHHDELVGKADFVGVNYYFRATATGTGAPLTPVIPLLDFVPTFSYRTDHNPTAAPCPSTCSDFGWEIYPPGIGEVVTTAGSYGLPVYITENGIADADDDQRPAYLVQHLQVLEQTIAGGVDVRGYYHWALMDNFEWSSGYFPMFGLYTVDPAKRLVARPSASYFRDIARANAIPPELAARFGQ